MNNIRIAAFVIAIILAAALCGCSKDEESRSSDISSVSDSSPRVGGVIDLPGGHESSNNSNSSDAPENPAEGSDSSAETSEPLDASSDVGYENATFLTGPAGDTIYKSELIQIINNDGTDGTPENFSEETFQSVLCEGFAYLAEPTGVCRTELDDPDVYDSENMTFTDVSIEPLMGYKRVEVGDEICGLTLTSAQCSFTNSMDSYEVGGGDGMIVMASELGFPGIYFSGGKVGFSGEIELTGYVCAAAEDGLTALEGDIIFIPSGGECMLPVMSYKFDPKIGFVHYQKIGRSFGIASVNEYGTVSLGNIRETQADVSALPDDGSFVKAKVTVGNIEMLSSVDWLDVVWGDLIDLEILE